MYYDEDDNRFSDFLDFIKEDSFEFYGVCNNEFKLNDTVWEAIEDSDDGYRSYLDCITKIDTNGIFFRSPLANVKVIEKCDYNGGGNFDGYALVDLDDSHEWLVFGTNKSDNYYPCFIFHYEPKLPREELIEQQRQKDLMADQLQKELMKGKMKISDKRKIFIINDEE